MAIVPIMGLGATPTVGTSFLTLINEDMARPLAQLKPPGPAWNKTAGSIMDSFCRAISYSFTRVQRRALELVKESDPRFTCEMLDDWERAFGLPGDCEQPTDKDGRRDVLLSKIRGFGTPNRGLITDLSELFGYEDIRFVKQEQFRTGQSQVGDQIFGEDWAFQEMIVVPCIGKETLFQCRLDEITHIYGTVLVQCWVPVHPALGSDDLYGISNDGLGTWVLVGDNGAIWLSTDNAITWSFQTPDAAFSGTFRAVMHDGSKFVAVGDQEVQTSPDGITWTQRSFASATFNARAIAFNGVDYVAVGEDSGSARVERSADGINWSVATAPPVTTDLNDIEWNGTTFLTGGPSGVAAVSGNGDVWFPVTLAGAYAGTITGVGWNGSAWALVGSGPEIQTTTAANAGSGWTQRTVDASYAGTPADVHGAFPNQFDPTQDGVFFFVGSAGEIQASFDDGVTWQQEGTTLVDLSSTDLNFVWKDEASRWTIVGDAGQVLSS